MSGAVVQAAAALAELVGPEEEDDDMDPTVPAAFHMGTRPSLEGCY